MGRQFTPLLAYSETPADLNEYKKHLPFLGSYKLDGIRALALEYAMRSRSLKPTPSAYAQELAKIAGIQGFDGELLIKPSHVLEEGETIYHATFSAVQTQGCTEPLDWWIFDYADIYYGTQPSMPYEERYQKTKAVLELLGHPDIKLLEQRLLTTPEEIAAMEKEALDLGYEGLIVRRADAPYKCGRSSWPQGYLMKIVRKMYSEAVVEDMFEQMENTNEARIDARGYTVRSKHQAGMRPKGMLGGYIVRDLKSGAVFRVGNGEEGWTHGFREEAFKAWPRDKGRIMTYSYKPYGTKDAPRQPLMKGWRSPDDMS